MTDKKKFSCEYCYQPIGYVDMAKLDTPMTPGMFYSLYPDNGVPDPFHPSLTWRDFRCPYCRLRPFLNEDYLSLIDDAGNMSRIKAQKAEVFSCPDCGREYQHRSSLVRHKKEGCNA